MKGAEDVVSVERASRPLFRLATPPAPGAIAIIELIGDIDAALDALGIAPVGIGHAKRCDLAGVDQGVVVRWTDRHAQLMPHAGPHVVRTLIDRLIEIGAAEARRPDPRDAWPEARDLVEALMLETLALAQSPAAIDLLLDQPARWRAWAGDEPNLNEIEQVSRSLNRLIEPATVVAIGAPNVGKSTLTNALARSTVSIVSDEAGTTRDHVGARIELPSPIGGVVIRWVDAPGSADPGGEPDQIARDAAELARPVIAAADLVIHCGDAEHGFCDLRQAGVSADQPVLRVGARSDLGRVDGADLPTAAKLGRGVSELAERIRRELVPDDALDWPGPWLFHRSLPTPPDSRA